MKPESSRREFLASGIVMNVGGGTNAVFSVVAAFLGNDSGRFVVEVENVEL